MNNREKYNFSEVEIKNEDGETPLESNFSFNETFVETKKIKKGRKKRRSSVSRRKKPLWTCYFCSNQEGSLINLRKHYFANHDRKWVGCIKCRISVLSLDERRVHLDSCPEALTCDLCFTKFDAKWLLQHHFFIKHLGRRQKEPERMPCQRCGKVLKG